MQRGNLVAVVWHDKRDVRLLSTNSQPTDATIKRRTGQDVNDVPCPEVVINYNKFMGGVYLADQNRSYYDMGRDAKKILEMPHVVYDKYLCCEQLCDLQADHAGCRETPHSSFGFPSETYHTTNWRVQQ